MREKITSEFEDKIKKLEISEDERQIYLKKYTKSSLIELIIYSIILILMIVNAEKIISLCYMSLSTLIKNEFICGTILFILSSVVVGFLLTNVLLFGLSYFKKINIKDKTLIKYHKYTENIQFFLKGILIIYLILTIVFSNARVDGPSMEDSIHDSDRVVLWHTMYTPKDDDIIVARITLESYPNAYVEQGLNISYYIKRVVAVAGDEVTVSYKHSELGDMSVNGTHVEYITETQAYILFGNEARSEYETVVPDGKLIIMGDNRNNSSDSRKFGMLNTEDVMGKVVFRIYPFNKFGVIDKQIKE